MTWVPKGNRAKAETQAPSSVYRPQNFLQILVTAPGPQPPPPPWEGQERWTRELSRKKTTAEPWRYHTLAEPSWARDQMQGPASEPRAKLTSDPLALKSRHIQPWLPPFILELFSAQYFQGLDSLLNSLPPIPHQVIRTLEGKGHRNAGPWIKGRR